MPITRARTQTSATKSQTVARAAQILACFSEARPHLTLADLAAQLKLNPSTVYRYVASLQQAGLLERDPRQGGYRLGLRVIELAGIALNQIEVRKHALDELDRLRDETQLLANLGVLIEGDVLHLAQSPTRDVPRMYTVIGRRAVAHCTALGKVLLAHRPWEEVRDVIRRHGWRPYTRHSIQSFDRLRTELSRVQERGYAMDRNERRLGAACVAVPIRDRSGRVIAALSVSGAADKLSEDSLGRLVPRVIEAANQIASRLGYQGS